MHHFSMSWEITLLYFFRWNFTWFGQKEPIKVQYFRLLTVHVKFYQICTLIVSFCWKYITFQLKKRKAFMFHDTEELCKIWRKVDFWLRKWHEDLAKFLTEHLEVSKLGLWGDSYIQGRKCTSLTFTEELRVMTLKNDAKFEEKLTCRLKFTWEIWKFDLIPQNSKEFSLQWAPFEESTCLS